jgi:hypothetical protein
MECIPYTHPRIGKDAIPKLTLDCDDGIFTQLNIGRDAFLATRLGMWWNAAMHLVQELRQTLAQVVGSKEFARTA